MLVVGCVDTEFTIGVFGLNNAWWKGAMAYQLENTSSHTMTEVNQR